MIQIPSENPLPINSSRRGFLAASTAGVLVAQTGVHSALAQSKSKSANDKIRIGLIGAGGRGGGAVTDSLSINDNVVLSAIADLDADKPARTRSQLERKYETKIDCPDSRLYTGLDAYKKILDNPQIDVVLFATPPGFRPGHIADAIAADKHVFAEKPTCIDPYGYKICLEAHDQAIANKKSIVTGTQYRRQTNYVEAVNKVHQGAIGDIIGGTSRYCSSGIWFKNRREGMSDTQYQIYNWMHYIWLSGDQICEQAVHNIDLMNWIMQGPPEVAFGDGGRFTRPEGSEMWDSMAIDYQYPGNRFISFKCRQIPDTATENATIIHGSDGWLKILGIDGGSFIYDRDGNEKWSMLGSISRAYQQEHKDLIDSIRAGEPIVELKETAASSLTAVMGRFAAYTGQSVDWDFVTNKSEMHLFPEAVDLTAARPSSFAIPGETKLV